MEILTVFIISSSHCFTMNTKHFNKRITTIAVSKNDVEEYPVDIDIHIEHSTTATVLDLIDFILEQTCCNVMDKAFGKDLLRLGFVKRGKYCTFDQKTKDELMLNMLKLIRNVTTIVSLDIQINLSIETVQFTGISKDNQAFTIELEFLFDRENPKRCLPRKFIESYKTSMIKNWSKQNLRDIVKTYHLCSIDERKMFGSGIFTDEFIQLDGITLIRSLRKMEHDFVDGLVEKYKDNIHSQEQSVVKARMKLSGFIFYLVSQLALKIKKRRYPIDSIEGANNYHRNSLLEYLVPLIYLIIALLWGTIIRYILSNYDPSGLFIIVYFVITILLFGPFAFMM